jgi:hypothetical protein
VKGKGVAFLSWEAVRDNDIGTFAKLVSFEDVRAFLELLQQVKLASVSGLVVNLDCSRGVANETLVHLAFKAVTEELGGY